MTSPCRVVVIEDSSADRATIRRSLLEYAACSIEIDEADEGEAGLALVKRGRPAAVLLGQMLRGMSGLEVLAQLRAEHGVGLPVLFLASEADEVTALEALGCGAQDYVVRDELASPALCRAITKAIGRAEREARGEQAAARAAQLQAITAALSQALTPLDVISLVSSRMIEIFGGCSGFVALLSEDGRALKSFVFRGHEAIEVGSWWRIPLETSVPICDAVRTNEVVACGSIAERIERYPLLVGVATHLPALVAIPMRDGDRMLGGIGISFDLARLFTPEDLAFARALASRCAEALVRARTHEAATLTRAAALTAPVYEAEARVELAQSEAQARTILHVAPLGVLPIDDESRWTERDLRFLSVASSALAASLDLEATLKRVVKLAGSYLGNGCGIDLLEDDGKLWRVASFYEDHAKADAAPSQGKRWERDPRFANDPTSVLRTGQSLHVPFADEAYYDASRFTPTHRARLDALGLHSFLQVALRGSERVLGVLTIGISATGRRFTDRDIAVAEEFGRRAGQAIENARSYRDAQAAAALRDQIISVVSHDLRNPLNVVYSQGWILSKRAVSTPELEWLVRPLARIERSARKMTGIVAQLLDVATLQAGRRLDLTLAPTDLVAIAHSVAEELQTIPNSASIRITSATPEVWGSWDRGRLEQVVMNLAGNAVKYCPPGSQIEMRILIEPSDAGSDGPTAVLKVCDNGIGIPASDLDHVFDWFRRGANVTGRIEGTGVGLASARMILAQHGGSITADSREGQGATFTVRLPIEPLSR